MSKPQLFDYVRLTEDQVSICEDREVIVPKGTCGTIVEIYSTPSEGYEFDPSGASGISLFSIERHQFEIVEPDQE